MLSGSFCPRALSARSSHETGLSGFDSIDFSICAGCVEDRVAGSIMEEGWDKRRILNFGQKVTSVS